ncbi:hypothetical protein OEB99_03200 [Actinotalea sp. M2MS4P-6]|uniref:hypothetical protein n=1 Tax=Actinotalea sp. M2MS4P-6 TaxID=2983762 RepID=UPI0021E3F86E|nr:hypothetical protein [Actinotalea sp. M2MS4P-6]MCV2393305.1 hypothetical protein [Actinotalea sp. M2MS4P-6]
MTASGPRPSIWGYAGRGVVVGFVVFIVWGFVSPILIERDKYEYFGFTWINLFGWEAIGVIGGLALGAVAISRHDARVRAAADTQRVAAGRLERERHAEQRRQLEERISGYAARAEREFTGLPTTLTQAADLHDEALEHFREGAYSPFWSAIERAFVLLGTYNAALRTIQTCADDHARTRQSYLAGGGSPDVVAPFPVTLVAAEATGAAEPVAAALRTLAYRAQKDPVYAQIWEQRRTTAAVVQGFTSLEHAVGSLATTVQQSTLGLVHELRSVGAGVGRATDAITTTATEAERSRDAAATQLRTTVERAVWLLDDHRQRAAGWRT